ncbi:MAG: glycosyltransferase [Opitutaceae bacterium]|jgi:glycosyltransferase involved in cell wall biosynthesis
MLRQSFYYKLKPYLPWRMRMALRRIVARRKRAEYRAVWPIDESTSCPPTGWPGWPDGKRSALVLSHDVEGPEGLARCQRLMALEQEMGFKSSFNFIPAGPYQVSAELRSQIAENGFEVGVHDLAHDGRLFTAPRHFQPKAEQINHYLHEWGAVGFRAGFMLRNLDSIQQLDILYDASTFDTDPFELQSKGTGTIFPFWIEAPPVAHDDPGHQVPLGNASIARHRGGYVELPYTLAQDSTLFLVFHETSPEIWMRKLDWIVEHRGMALVNVHPDYLRFEDEPATSRTYPVSHYRKFLEYFRDRYRTQCWQPRPKDVAAFAAQLQPRPKIHRPKHVCMVTHSFYETDNRVTRYAEALTARGDSVDVFAIRRSPQLPRKENINGVNVYRIQDRFQKKEQSKLAYLLPLLRFLASSFWRVTRSHARRRYDLLHVHNMPDFLVFAAWYPRLTGSKVILDIHDIMPELYSSKFGGKKNLSIVPVLTKWMERRSARFAQHIIIANDLWIEKYTTRTGTQGKCSVFINNVDTRVFQPRTRTRHDGKIILLFPGGLQWHQGLDIAIRAFEKVSRELPQAEFHIYGDGNMKPFLIALAAKMGFDGRVKFFDPLRIAEIADVMANADLGVVPKRADSFGNEAYSTKIMEFMSLGVPVVISKTKIDQFYFDDSVVRFFESGNVDALADGILDVLRHPDLRQRLVANASDYSRRNNWESRKPDYLRLVDSLCLPA